MPKIRPRDDASARSFNQLSTIIAAPAKQKPDRARTGIQTQGVIKISERRTAIDAMAHMAPNARIWPTLATSAGVRRQPATYPTAQPVPSRPRTSRILAVFEPTTFPTAMSAFPRLIATTEVTSSGKLVPRATAESPITDTATAADSLSTAMTLASKDQIKAMKSQRGDVHRIVLIDGGHLARLMIAHGVGVRTRRTFAIQGVDEKVLETFTLCEAVGINTMILRVDNNTLKILKKIFFCKIKIFINFDKYFIKYFFIIF